MNKDRERGYYWVMYRGEKESTIAYYDEGRWWMVGIAQAFDDSDFSAIDVRPIRKE